MADDEKPNEPDQDDNRSGRSQAEDLAFDLVRGIASGVGQMVTSLLGRGAPHPPHTPRSTPQEDASSPVESEPDNVIDIEDARNRRQRETRVHLDLTLFMNLLRSLATAAATQQPAKGSEEAEDPQARDHASSGIGVLLDMIGAIAAIKSGSADNHGQEAPPQDGDDEAFTRLRFEIDVPKWLADTVSALFSGTKAP